MEIKFENKDKVCMENCDIIKNRIGVYGFYGLTCFEIGLDDGYNSLSLLDKKDLYDLKECIDKMIEEIERLEKIGD